MKDLKEAIDNMKMDYFLEYRFLDVVIEGGLIGSERVISDELISLIDEGAKDAYIISKSVELHRELIGQ